jgi:hypothetical protein
MKKISLDPQFSDKWWIYAINHLISLLGASRNAHPH